jgi:hypothetical protein
MALTDPMVEDGLSDDYNEGYEDDEGKDSIIGEAFEAGEEEGGHPDHDLPINTSSEAWLIKVDLLAFRLPTLPVVLCRPL